MSKSSRPGTPVADIRAQLRTFAEEQGGEPGSAYLFDEMVGRYLSRFGAVPVDSVPTTSLFMLLLDHSVDGYAAGPCPSWCELVPGHGYASVEMDTGRDVRDHGRRLSTHVDLTLMEYQDAPLFSEPMRLFVSVDCDDMAAADVRTLAAELLNAADELDRAAGCDTWTEDQL